MLIQEASVRIISRKEESIHLSLKLQWAHRLSWAGLRQRWTFFHHPSSYDDIVKYHINIMSCREYKKLLVTLTVMFECFFSFIYVSKQWFIWKQKKTAHGMHIFPCQSQWNSMSPSCICHQWEWVNTDPGNKLYPPLYNSSLCFTGVTL